MSDWTPTLPGLDLDTSGVPDATPLHDAARATLAALDTAGLLEARHALTCQTILSLSVAADRGLASAKVSVATSTLVRHLMDAYEQLPQPTADVADDGLVKLLDELNKASA